MYKGTLIDDLIETVERAEQNIHFHGIQESNSMEFETWHMVTAFELKAREQNLLGVA